MATRDAARYQLSIITPRGQVFSAEVEALTAPGSRGRFGILAGHAPLVARLAPGMLKITKDGAEIFYRLAQGVLEVDEKHNALILTDEARITGAPEPAKNPASRWSRPDN
jgi:F-type H+-transporting ATPase subunit epsilon